MKISIGQNRVETEALDIGYDANDNRRHVLHWLAVYNATTRVYLYAIEGF